MNAVDVRRARMSTDVAEPLFHHHRSFSMFVPENCRRDAAGSRQTLQLVEWDTVCGSSTVLQGLKSLHQVDLMKQQELFDTIRTKDAADVAALLDADPSLLDARQNGITPILFAVYCGRSEVPQLFIDRGARLTFWEACAVGDEATATRMLDDDPSLLDTYSEDGFP